jgi:serine protease Do
MNGSQIMKSISAYLSKRLPTFALGGALIMAGTALAVMPKPASKAEPQTTPVSVVLDERPVTRDGVGRASFAPVIKKVSPGVVRVFTTIKAQKTGLSGGSDMNDLMRRFFGDQFQGRMPRGNFGTPRQEGVGSGVIATKDGYILTNNHVVDGADEVKVALQDGREFTAKVIGRDPKSDVAVIKIDATDLPAVPMADSDKVEVGDVVLAIGNPFGIGQTVTTGIVSAKGRGNMGLDYEDFIQTDAAINPGNSGGALVDADGRLIGINTAILSRSGGNQGIGFAIPVNLARDEMQSLIKDGHVTRGYLGVMIQDLTPALAKEFKLKDATGALIGDVTPKGPAEKAGLKSGDLLVEFNGKKVADSRHLKLEVARTQPGQTVPVKILRDGTEKTLEVTVKTLPGTESLAKNDKGSDDTGTLNGVGVTDLDEQAREQLKVPETVKGAVVTEVKPDSAAAEAGLKPGDIIQEINRKPVKNAEEAVRLTENPSDKTSLLRVWREGGSRFVVVDESKAG